MKDPVRGYVSLFVVVVVIGCLAGAGAGCSTPRPVIDVRNPDPSGKIPAYKEAVRDPDPREVRQMVKDLDSDDPAIRLFAIVALRRLTDGETFGYQYFDDEHQRRPAIKRWQAWLTESNSGGASDAPKHASGR
jgi:hypothetical protein